MNLLVFIDAMFFCLPEPPAYNRRMRSLIDRLRAKGLWCPALTSVELHVPTEILPQRVDFEPTISMRYKTYWAIKHSRVSNLHVCESMTKKGGVVLHSARFSDKPAEKELSNEWLNLSKISNNGGSIWHQALIEYFKEGDEMRLAMVNCLSFL